LNVFENLKALSVFKTSQPTQEGKQLFPFFRIPFPRLSAPQTCQVSRDALVYHLTLRKPAYRLTDHSVEVGRAARAPGGSQGECGGRGEG